jgi:hypothetical protein
VANYRTTQDIAGAVLFHAGEMTDGSSEFSARVLDYINRAYRAIWTGGGEFLPSGGEDWWWLRSTSPGTLTLEPAITALTANVTRGSTSVTFSAAPTPLVDTNVAGWHVRFGTDLDVFRIASHSAGSTSATLDSVYTGNSGTGVASVLFKLEYALPSSVMRVLSPMRTGSIQIPGYDSAAFDRVWPPTMARAEDPEAFLFLTDRRIRFNAYPTQLRRVEYGFIPIPADLTNAPNEEPLVPLEWRHILVDGALYFLLLDKQDPRADAAALRFRSGLQAMAVENRRRMRVAAGGAKYGRLVPDVITATTASGSR